MAIIQLRSENPDLSWVLVKNPESGMLIKSLKKGKLFGWYSNQSTYNIYFRDVQNDISYKSHQFEDFEYINVSRYNSPVFVLNAISDLFATALKNDNEKDTVGFKNEFTINMFFVKNPKYLEIFNKYFDDFEIEYVEVANKNYRITIKTSNTIKSMLNFVNLFVIFNALKSDVYFNIDESLIYKYIQSLEVIDANYFIRYVFKVNFLIDKKKFDELQHILENSNKYNIKFQFGDTATQRRKFLESIIDYNKPVIDIGCGEGRTGLKIAEKLKDHPYIGIDVDKESRRAIYWKSKSRCIKNLRLFKSFFNYKMFVSLYNLGEFGNDHTILLFEVIEHMEINRATFLLQDVKDYCAEKNNIIITTPNKEFNQFYNFDEGEFRHDDHKFEFTKPEFKEFIERLFLPDMYQLDYYDIGDTVNGISPTQGVVIKYKGFNNELL